MAQCFISHGCSENINHGLDAARTNKGPLYQLSVSPFCVLLSFTLLSSHSASTLHSSARQTTRPNRYFEELMAGNWTSLSRRHPGYDVFSEPDQSRCHVNASMHQCISACVTQLCMVGMQESMTSCKSSIQSLVNSVVVVVDVKSCSFHVFLSTFVI